MIEECLQLAIYAPNATNAQSWRWLVVTDPDLRAQVGAIYRDVLLPISTRLRDERLASGDADGLRHSSSVLHLAEHLGEVPVLVVPCIEGTRRPPGQPRRGHRRLRLHLSRGVELPARVAQPRARLGVHERPPAARAGGSRPILGIPNGFTQTCLIPVAYTKRQRLLASAAAAHSPTSSAGTGGTSDYCDQNSSLAAGRASTIQSSVTRPCRRRRRRR